MRFVLTVLLCLFCGLSLFAQTESAENSEKTKVKSIILAREDAEGNIEENVETFEPADFPIYIYVDMSQTGIVNVKMNLVAVKAKGLRANTKVVVVSYKTKDNENNVQFRASPRKFWAVGDYRVDVFLDGQIAESKNFKVKTSEK